MERIPTPEPVPVPLRYQGSPMLQWYRMGFRAGWHHMDHGEERGPHPSWGEDAMNAYGDGCTDGRAARQQQGR